MTLSVSIMHAPWADYRKGWMRTAIAEARKGSDHVRVVEDHKREGIWPTARRAWMTATGTHHLVLQDDVELCQDFMLHAEQAVAANPDNAISFFMFAGKAHKKAVDAGSSWVTARGHSTGLAVAMPTTLIDEFLRWSHQNVPATFRHDDTRLSWFLELTGRELWFTIPCLADHLGDKVSVAGNRPPIKRVAPHFQRSYEPVDWARGLQDRVTSPLHSPASLLAEYRKLRGEAP